MINKIASTLIIIFSIAVLSLPHLIVTGEVLAQGSGSGLDGPSEASATNPLVKCKTVDQCNWQEFLNTVDRVKNYAFQIVVVLSVIFIAIAGFYYLTAGDNAGKRETAKSIIQNVVIGFFLAAAGWLIVRTILKTLGAGENDPGMVPTELRS